jgi:hypothetical protein
VCCGARSIFILPGCCPYMYLRRGCSCLAGPLSQHRSPQLAPTHPHRHTHAHAALNSTRLRQHRRTGPTAASIISHAPAAHTVLRLRAAPSMNAIHGSFTPPHLLNNRLSPTRNSTSPSPAPSDRPPRHSPYPRSLRILIGHDGSQAESRR